MTQRELSEKLYKFAVEIEGIVEGNVSNTTSKRILTLIADELHELSNQNYTPGTTSWKDIKPTPNKPSKTMKYTNKQGRPTPF